MIYFTADTHFGHENVIRFCSRPYATAAEMDEALIENWNSRVKGNDTVLILQSKKIERTTALGPAVDRGCFSVFSGVSIPQE